MKNPFKRNRKSKPTKMELTDEELHVMIIALCDHRDKIHMKNDIEQPHIQERLNEVDHLTRRVASVYATLD